MSSQPAFRLFGFPVHVRSGFYLFMVVVVIANGAPLGVWLAGFIAVLTLLHELGHAVAARATGARAEISLDFLAGYAAFVPIRPLKRWERAGISFAGPAIQISVSVVALLGHGCPPAAPRRRRSRDAARALWWAGPVIGIFNLLPILPFDGGNIVLAGLDVFLPKKSPDRHALRQLGDHHRRWVVAAQPARLGTNCHLRGDLPAHGPAADVAGPPPSPPVARCRRARRGGSLASGDVSRMLPEQIPSPWFRAYQHLHQSRSRLGACRAARCVRRLRAQPRWMPPDRRRRTHPRIAGRTAAPARCRRATPTPSTRWPTSSCASASTTRRPTTPPTHTVASASPISALAVARGRGGPRRSRDGHRLAARRGDPRQSGVAQPGTGRLPPNSRSLAGGPATTNDLGSR